MDYTIRIAGEAGQGLQTMGAALAKIFSRMHYHVFTHQDYMSRIRGGHNIYQIRISDKPISASRQLVHIVVPDALKCPLNKEVIVDSVRCNVQLFRTESCPAGQNDADHMNTCYKVNSRRE